MKKKLMFVLLMTTLLAVALVGCGKKKTPAPAPAPVATQDTYEPEYNSYEYWTSIYPDSYFLPFSIEVGDYSYDYYFCNDYEIYLDQWVDTECNIDGWYLATDGYIYSNDGNWYIEPSEFANPLFDSCYVVAYPITSDAMEYTFYIDMDGYQYDYYYDPYQVSYLDQWVDTEYNTDGWYLATDGYIYSYDGNWYIQPSEFSNSLTDGCYIYAYPNTY